MNGQLALSERPAKPRRAESSEMKSLLAAMEAGGEQAELPGLGQGLPVKYIGDGWWQVEGSRRCWHTVTIRALLKRQRLQRAGALTMILAGVGQSTPRQPLTEG